MMYDAAFRKAYATVAWYEQFRAGNFVFMRRGTGEIGWWHSHQDEPADDYGGNPMDYKHELEAFVCRSCGCRFDGAEADKARAPHEWTAIGAFAIHTTNIRTAARIAAKLGRRKSRRTRQAGTLEGIRWMCLARFNDWCSGDTNR